MAQRELRGANGQVELKYEWVESSSTHFETETKISLAALNDKELILAEEYKKTNFFRFNEREKSTKKYKISVDELIKLIKQHGSKV